MWVESEPDVGSAFFFTLTAAIAQPTRESTIEKLQPFENRTLLLVDSARDKEHLKIGLEDMGLRTFRISNATVLKKKDAFPHIDSIIVDSIDVTNEIRDNEHLRYIPIVLLTAPSLPLNLKWCLDNTISSHALSPCVASDLTSSIIAALESSIASPTVSPSDIIFDILLAEDNQVNQKLAIKLLERYGHNIDIAENGSLAVELFKERIGEGRPFDVILVYSFAFSPIVLGY